MRGEVRNGGAARTRVTRPVDETGVVISMATVISQSKSQAELVTHFSDSLPTTCFNPRIRHGRRGVATYVANISCSCSREHSDTEFSIFLSGNSTPLLAKSSKGEYSKVFSLKTWKRFAFDRKHDRLKIQSKPLILFCCIFQTNVFKIFMFDRKLFISGNI